MTIGGLRAYLIACRQWERPDCLVTGHPAPDGDAVFSALFEGWRRYLTAGQRAMPVVPAVALPREAAWLLGELAPLLPTEEALARYPHAPLVLTDCHTAPGRTILAVVDHHPPAPTVDLTGVEANIQPVGAATTLVALACRRQELVPDDAVARLLLGAILLDTEGLLPSKAKPEDGEMAAVLSALSGEEPGALYAALRAQLLAETDVHTLYERDYRLYADGRLGFAVLKVWADAAPAGDDLRRLLQQDAAARGLVAGVAKVSLYGRDGGYAERYMVAGQPAVTERLVAAIAACGGTAAEYTASDEVYLPPQATHRGRKTVAPRLVACLEE